MTDTEHFEKAEAKLLLDKDKDQEEQEQGQKGGGGTTTPGFDPIPDPSTDEKGTGKRPNRDLNYGYLRATENGAPTEDQAKKKVEDAFATKKEDHRVKGAENDIKEMSIAEDEAMLDNRRKEAENTQVEVDQRAKEYAEERGKKNWNRMEAEQRAESMGVPNYREHVTDEQMQGWGRALARYGARGLKQGANAIDAATKALGEFRKLTRAFLSPNPMSAPSQMLASTMVGFNTMYDTIDKAGEIAGIKQGADRSIVMETQKGAQYYKDKDRAEQAANFIMQTYNDTIRDVIGPDGDPTQITHDQLSAVMGRMDKVLGDEVARIRQENANGRPPSLEDRAIMTAYQDMNKRYKTSMQEEKKYLTAQSREGGAIAREYDKLDRENSQIDRKARSINLAKERLDLSRQKHEVAGRRLEEAEKKLLDAELADIENYERNLQRYVDDLFSPKGEISQYVMDILGIGDSQVKRNAKGGFTVKTIERAADKYMSDALGADPKLSEEDKEEYLIRAEFLRTHLRETAFKKKRLDAAKAKVNGEGLKPAGKKGTSILSTTPLTSSRDQKLALSFAQPKDYIDKKVEDWIGSNKFNIVWADNPIKSTYREAALKMLNKIAAREHKIYRAMDSGTIDEAQLAKERSELKGWYNSFHHLENMLSKPSQKVYRGYNGPKDRLKDESNKEVLRSTSHYASPINFERDLMKGMSDDERVDFLRDVFKDRGVFVPNPSKKRGYTAKLDEMKKVLDYYDSNISPEAKKVLFETVAKYRNNLGPKGKALIDSYLSKYTETGDEEGEKFEGEGEPRTPLDMKDPEVIKKVKSGEDAKDVLNFINETNDLDILNGLWEKTESRKSNKMIKQIRKLLMSRIDELSPKEKDEEKGGETPFDDPLGEGLKVDEPQDETIVGGTEGNGSELPLDTDEVQTEGEGVKEIEEPDVVEDEAVFDGDTEADETKLRGQAKKLLKDYEDALSSGNMEAAYNIAESIENGKAGLTGDARKRWEDLERIMDSRWENWRTSKNEENKEALRTGGSNVPETGEPVGNTSMDEENFKTPTDPRRVEVDPNEMEFSEGSKFANMTERDREVATITDMIESVFGKKAVPFEGLNPKEMYLDKESGKIKWGGASSKKVTEDLGAERKSIGEELAKIPNFSKKTDLEKKREEMTEIYERVSKKLEFIKNNFKSIPKKNKKLQEYTGKDMLEKLDEMYRFIYAWDWKKDIKNRWFAKPEAKERKDELNAHLNIKEIKKIEEEYDIRIRPKKKKSNSSTKKSIPSFEEMLTERFRKNHPIL